jgi:DNA topoisomerase-1
MAKSLIIVESPAKTKTLKNFLGNDFQVEASMGHVRDLPEHRLGVDVNNDFKLTYQPLPDREDVLKRLMAAARTAQTVYLASDPDREGEAIAWHLAEALQLKNPRRIQFNEITRQAVQQALQHPRTVNMDRVNAQQARRVLDRLIGYKLSPVLSAKIQRGLSAGRVQSVAVRLICEREREIQAFVPQEYWSLTATLTPIKPEKRFPFAARLHSRSGQRVEPKSEAEINVILADIEGARYEVADVKKREQKRNAAPPFITSTLQQEASRKLGFGNKRTMSVAQQLYEGVDLGAEGSIGLITYMRTDSVRVAAEAQQEARQFITEKYGAPYVPATAKQFKTKGEAQDAHEAIRPTSAFREPEKIAPYLSPEQLRLYRLIWQRFIASQMNPAVMDVTTADIAALTGRPVTHEVALAVNETGKARSLDPNAPYLFRATGSVMKFDGFMRVYTEGKDTEEVADDEQPPLPPLSKEQPLDLIKMEPRQHFTEPPPRYTEATIVKALEEQGIGRPSTYASIISTIRDRKYVELLDKRFHPTELGFTVTDQLVKHFSQVINVKFTADMETKLDEVEEGKAEWLGLVRNFYDPFEQSVALAKVEMENLKPAPVETQYHCPATGRVMVERQGRFGPFISCSGYPECKKILKLNADGTPVEGLDFVCGLDPNGKTEKAPATPSVLSDGSTVVCPKALGVMLQRKGRFGDFLGCSSYPKCRTLLKLKPDGTLQEGQEIVCTYKESAAKKGAKAGAETADATAANGAKKTTRAAKAASTTRATAAKAGTSKTAAKSTTRAAAGKTAATKSTAARTTGAKSAATKTITAKATAAKSSAAKSSGVGATDGSATNGAHTEVEETPTTAVTKTARTRGAAAVVETNE